MLRAEDVEEEMKVNSKIQPIRTIYNSGDIVED